MIVGARDSMMMMGIFDCIVVIAGGTVWTSAINFIRSFLESWRSSLALTIPSSVTTASWNVPSGAHSTTARNNFYMAQKQSR